MSQRGLSRDVFDERVMQGYPPPREWRVRLQNIYEPPFTHWYLQHVRDLVGTAPVPRGKGAAIDLPRHPRNLGRIVIQRAQGGTWTVADALKETYTDGFLVLHHGKIVAEQYFHGMRAETPHLWMSASKSLGSCVAANLVERGCIDPEANITDYVPELAGSAYGDAQVRHLLDMLVGVHYVEDYADPDSDAAKMERVYGLRASVYDDEPGSSYDLTTTMVKEGEHGEVFHYVSLDTQVLAWVMERVTNMRVAELVGQEVWSGLGTEHEAYISLDGAGAAQLEGGFCSSLRDMARFGQMLCEGGLYGGCQVVPESWVDDTIANGDRDAFARCEEAARMWAGGRYRNNFWIIERGGHTSFMAIGMFGQMVYVNRDADLVACKFSSYAPLNFQDMSLYAEGAFLGEGLAEALG